MKPYHLPYMEKCKKSHTEIMNLKYQLRREMKSLIYTMDHILYPIFNDYFKYILKNMGSY